MQKDFHYGAVRVIAEKAGFSPKEAQVIAYSSQFVDDATEHKPLRIPQFYKQLNWSDIRFDGKYFDPICTAHKGIQFFQDFKKEVQQKIYIPFHFIPPEPFNNQKKYSYITKPNSNFSRILVNRALKFLQKRRSVKNLIRLGIALHTYMDTWSHQDFSGILSYKDNNIDKIEIYDGKTLKKITSIERIKNSLLPPIGHAQAYDYPDLPFLIWSYVKASSPNKRILRNNPQIFYKAGKHLFEILCKFNKCQNSWNDIKEKFWLAVNYINHDENERLDFFKRIFKEINFFYNEKLWKNDILNPPSFTDKSIRIKRNTCWFLFHKAALEQRLFVIEHIKQL